MISMFIKLSDTHAFNCIVFMVKFGRTSCEDIPPALCYYITLPVHSVSMLLTFVLLLMVLAVSSSSLSPMLQPQKNPLYTWHMHLLEFCVAVNLLLIALHLSD